MYRHESNISSPASRSSGHTVPVVDVVPVAKLVCVADVCDTVVIGVVEQCWLMMTDVGAVVPTGTVFFRVVRTFSRKLVGRRILNHLLERCENNRRRRLQSFALLY